MRETSDSRRLRLPSYFLHLHNEVTHRGQLTMAIETYYVQGTKKETNQRIADGLTILAKCYSMVNEHTKPITELKQGDVIKFWTKKVGSSPVAKAYGNWDAKKQRVK